MPSVESMCLEMQPSLKRYGALQRQMASSGSECSPTMLDHVLHGYVDVESCKNFPKSITCGRPCTGDLDQYCTWRFTKKCVVMHSCGLDLRRSLCAVASQAAERQPERSCTVEALEMHTARSPEAEVPANRVCIGGDRSLSSHDTAISKETDAKSKANGRVGDKPDESKAKVAQGEALEALEALLKKMEVSVGVSDPKIGAICLRLAQLCDSADEEPEKILSYGQRALKVFGSFEASWERASCLHVIGYAYFKMDEFQKTVVQLEQSSMVLKKLRATVSEQDIRTLKHAVETLLGQAKISLGRHHEALTHFQEAIAINEQLLEPGNPDLAASYLQAAQAYKDAKDPDEAICLCFKALPIYTNYYGASSSQVADVRRLMSVVYFDLEEFEDALSEYETVRPILEGLGKSEEVASLDLASVESFFRLEKYDEAIAKLKTVVRDTAETSPSHGNALVMLARAYAILKRDKSVAKYCKKALDVFKMQKLSVDIGTSLVSLALVHQRQQEYEQATEIYKRALENFNQCHEHQAAAAAADIEGQIGFLLLHVEKVDEALPYLESSVAKKKSIHGPESEEVLDVYNHLGVAYSQVGKLDEALEQFEAAKVVLSENFKGVDSLTISIYNNLANMYSVFGRLDEAIECQKIIVDSIKNNNGVETMVSLEEAEKTLEEFLQEAKSRKSSHGKD